MKATRKLRRAVFVWLLFVVQSGAQDASPTTAAAGLRDSAEFLQRAERHSKFKDHEKDIDQLLARMTLREKVGQMTQLTVQMITNGMDQSITIDPAKLQKAVVDYGVGSILNVHDEALPPAAWHKLLGEIQAAARRTRLQIPVLYGIDSIHGANYVQGATLFPQPLAMAATWDPPLLLEASRITAEETRAAGIPWSFSPVLDIGRQPLWPRLYETYGEDPHLAQTMGVAVVRGYQGDDPSDDRRIAACLKHYIGYSGPTTGHDRTPALIPENTLREYYLPTFRAAVQAGALSVMVNSGEVNGVPGHANRYLLTDVLRTELGFDGVVVSDWEDIKKLVTLHRVAATEKDATRMAVMAGIDMSMVPLDYSFADLLTQLVEEGSVPMTRIDEATRRILRMKYRLGLFERPSTDEKLHARIGTGAARQVSLQAAREAITLLKNNGNVLPLHTGTRVLLTGPTADTLISLNNGWTYTWQGNRVATYPKDRPTLRQALQQRAGEQNFSYVPGVDFDKELDIAAARTAAENADVIVLALGESSYTETPGNINDLTLSEPQLRLAEAMTATGKPVVLVLIEGRPRIISRIADQVPAIVMAYNPSNEGGQAIANVLFGEVNPSGRLPITYPRNADSLFTYDRKESEVANGGRGSQPQFEFGAGLSYTTFAYSDLIVAPTVVEASGTVRVAVKVTNTGTRVGSEVVQVYLADLVASIAPPAKRLVRYARISLQPGKSELLAFTLDRNDLSFIGADNKPTLEPGDFEVSVGGMHLRFALK